MVVNPFHVIVAEETSPGRDRISRLLGLPYGTDEQGWPRRDGRALHHLCTLEVVQLDTPWDDEMKAISIFVDFDTSADFTGPPLTDTLEVYWLDESALNQGPASDYPDDYEPWWYEDDPQAAAYRNGRTAHLQQLDVVPEGAIKEVLAGEQMPGDLPRPLVELVGTHSFVGGFPIWVQEDETPLDEEGERMNYILTLNGFHPLLETSPVALGVLYLFSDQVGQSIWIAQD